MQVLAVETAYGKYDCFDCVDIKFFQAAYFILCNSPDVVSYKTNGSCQQGVDPFYQRLFISSLFIRLLLHAVICRGKRCLPDE